MNNEGERLKELLQLLRTCQLKSSLKCVCFCRGMCYEPKINRLVRMMESTILKSVMITMTII